MNIKFKLQSLILVLLVLLVCPCFVFAQNGKKVAGKSIPQEIKWEKWGLEFSVPSDMKESIKPPEDNTNSADEYVSGGAKRFERPLNSKLKITYLDLSVNVTSWKGEKVKTEFESGKVELSPEQMLQLDFIGDTSGVEKADSPQIEAKYLEIDGQKGIFSVRNLSLEAGKTIKPENTILVVWGTYRVFKGNVQQVIVGFEGKRKDLEVMKKVINSFKFH